MARGGPGAAPGLAGAYRRGTDPRLQPGWTHARHWELGWRDQAVGPGTWRPALDELAVQQHPEPRVCPGWTHARQRRGRYHRPALGRPDGHESADAHWRERPGVRGGLESRWEPARQWELRWKHSALGDAGGQAKGRRGDARGEEQMGVQPCLWPRWDD